VILNPDVETAPWEEQPALDDHAYKSQIAYLRARSAFYREKLAGHEPAGLERIAELPFTEKSELKATATPENPIGAHLCVGFEEIARIYSTSGTTGNPSYIPLAASDRQNWLAVSARAYAAAGIAAGQKVVTTYGAGPFVAGAVLDAFEQLGLTHIPVGTGNSERLIRAIELLEPEVVALTPSYAAHLLDRDEDLAGSSVERLLVAGEPGGGEPALRAQLEEGWGAKVTEAMGIGDIGVSIWGECEEQDGMHFAARGFVHPELIDPGTGAALDWSDGGEGELVLTHLWQRAAPLLRFRTRDHVHVKTGPCPCGRTAPRIRCIGRTDDMLIVRGVNVFPSAVRSVVGQFAPDVSGHIRVRPSSPGVKQQPPLPVSVELARDASPDDSLADAISARLREVLVVQVQVELVPFGSLDRSEYKSLLVERQ
jgi:phenylacetate-CoA ligase